MGDDIAQAGAGFKGARFQVSREAGFRRHSPGRWLGLDDDDPGALALGFVDQCLQFGRIGRLKRLGHGLRPGQGKTQSD